MEFFIVIPGWLLLGFLVMGVGGLVALKPVFDFLLIVFVLIMLGSAIIWIKDMWG